jgi:hypothetical protein
MSVLKFESFGGVMPSVSARALPAAAAQTNQNLFLATDEFRPLASDATVTTGLAGAKTLYRLDSASAWITSTSELSYARGQINGDATKRTYYSNNTTPGVLRTFDSAGNDRILGVPAPTALSVATTAGAFFTADSLITSVQSAIRASLTLTEPQLRYSTTAPVSAGVVVAGPLTKPAGLYFTNDTVNLPSQVTSSPEYESLFAKVPISRVNDLKISLADIAVKYFDASFAYIPIAVLPRGYVENGTPLSTSLAAIVNPRTSVQVLDAAARTALIDDLNNELDTELNAYSRRVALTTIAKEFYNLLLVYPAEAATNPGAGPTDPTGTGPVVPTVPQYYIDGGSGLETLAPEWETYYADLTEYNLNKEIYNENLKYADIYNRSATDRVRELQREAQVITQEIEGIQQVAWDLIVNDPEWVSVRVYKGVATEQVDGIDADRIVQTRFYLVTFVNDRGEESAPSPPSTQQSVDQYSATTVSLPTVPASRNITKWRIYRSTTTADLTVFQFVAEFVIATTSYIDTVSNEALGEVIPTIGWDEPISGLKGLVSMPNGVMAAFKDNTLHFCEPYAPYAFPPSYRVTTEFPIVGLGVFGQTLFVGTTGNPYLISGSDSASMSSVKLDSNQSCVSRRSIASVPGGVIYASPDGLCIASSSGVQVVTRTMFTREDWQALVPSSIFGIAHEDIYYFFYNTGSVTGCYALDMNNKKLGTVTALTAVTTVYVDRETDELFANDNTNIRELFSTGRRTALWESGLITLPTQTIMSWLKVYGDQSGGTTATIRWYADGVLRHTAVVSSTEPVRLPAGRWLEHKVSVESAARVTKVVIASTTQELQNV